jgi:cobyrinic acid a,c-diamide synthase
VVESAMGLFDGVEGGAGRTGAAADLAARYGLPVLLVLDVSGQSQSAAAVARGFATHDPAVRIGGIVLNRVASDRHGDGVARALAPLGLPVLGGFPRDAAIALPERHLGLVQAVEQAGVSDLIDRLAELGERHLDLDGIAAMAAPIAPRRGTAPLLAPPGQRVALARDAAFSFIDPHELNGWRVAGTEVVAFSPLADEPPPDGCDACWLPGGYPELHAARLAQATRFRAGMARFAETRPVHGECGGYMVLGTSLEDAAGQRHPMLGLLGHATSFAHPRLHLGYREARLLADTALGRAGSLVRGHEFHYARLGETGEDAPLAILSDARGAALGPAGGRRGRVSGSFFHAVATVPMRGATE